MEQEVKDVILSIIRKDKSKKFALENWKNLNHSSWNILEVWQCIYDAANGNPNEIIKIVEGLTKKTKLYGRTQVYGDGKPSAKMDMYRDESGKLQLIGYDSSAKVTPELKGQKGHDNTKIFRKGDGQVNKRYTNTERTLMDVGAVLRKLYPNASKVFLTQALINIRSYAEKTHKSPLSVVERLANGKLKLDKYFRIVPFNAVVDESKQNKVIVITEEMAKNIHDKIEMTEYKFYSNVKQFLHDLLVDPINAKVPFLLASNGINRNKLLYYLISSGVVVKSQRINDTDENGEPKTATMMVKYKVPKKHLDRKLKRIYIKLFEKNVPEHIVNEDGEGGTCCGAMGATSADSSGQFEAPLFPIQRRKMKEDTTLSSVGDYQYDVPFSGDDETLKRNNGIGGSTSINRIDEDDDQGSGASLFYEYLSEYTPYTIFSMFEEKDNLWQPLINPSMYKQACEEFVKFGSFNRFPTKYIYQWMGIIIKNTAILHTLTEIHGHSTYFPMDDFLDYYFGDDDSDENGQSWNEWCEECGETDFYAAYNYLEARGFDDWANLPDGSDAVSDYGIEPLEQLINTYNENMSPEDCLILVNKCLDVVHQRGDLASAFITGGSQSCQDITYRQNESVKGTIYMLNEYLDKNMTKVKKGIENATDDYFEKWADKPYGEDDREIVHDAWMIHFAEMNDLRGIAKNGFTQGNSVDKTPEQVTYNRTKVKGGFNYAYLADDVLDSFNATSDVELNDLRSSFMYHLSRQTSQGSP